MCKWGDDQIFIWNSPMISNVLQFTIGTATDPADVGNIDDTITDLPLSSLLLSFITAIIIVIMLL